MTAVIGDRWGTSRQVLPHNPKVVGSNPTPATMNDEGLADASAANPFRLPRLHPGIGNSSSQRPDLRLRPLQPVRHPHLAVHRRRGGEVLLRLLALARASAELAEAEVAVGDEGAH